ncbi:MAG TPA: glucose 1-dehydrogenase, partial [Thermohalobaculum sp.]|nr:glucose 1-dehydrogenase [Thermohalobaculum sp.]
MPRLAGQIALITGAASGFGRGVAEAFAAEGAAVLVTDIDGDGAARVAEALASKGARAAACAADVSDRASLDRAVARCEAEFGALSILVANAGLGQRPAAFDDTPPETLRRQYEINAVGAMQTCQVALPALRRRGEGASILITVSGIALVPRPALYGYGMAKAAASYLMKSLALELAPERIRVNGLFPAVGDTPMLAEFAGGERTEENASAFANALPLGRLITPADVGAAAVFLSSPREAGAITGCVMTVDAG